MNMNKILLFSSLLGLTSGLASAAILLSGTTTVGLDTTVLGSIGLTVATAEQTGTPNTTGFAPSLAIVGFAITPGGTFSYDPATFPAEGSFAGTIEHSGFVTLNLDQDGEGGNPPTPVTIGQFTVSFDGARATGGRSGFFVLDNLDLKVIVFDVALLGSPAGGTSATGLTATNETFNLGPANLLVSPELAGALGNLALTGADLGDVRIDGLSVVPEPATLSLGAAALGLLLQRRRRQNA